MSSTAAQRLRVNFNIVFQWYDAVPCKEHRADGTGVLTRARYRPRRAFMNSSNTSASSAVGLLPASEPVHDCLRSHTGERWQSGRGDRGQRNNQQGGEYESVWTCEVYSRTD